MIIHPILPAAVLALGLITLAGCSSPTVITLNDGREIQALDEPHFDDDAEFYEYEQLDGKRGRVNKDEVRSIKEL
jgi:hypothetical protein